MASAPEGERLEHYRLGQKLAGGGMGEVFLATDLRLNRQVAIKFVTTDRADEGLTRRLLQEAQAVAALDHPCICPVYDGGRDADGRAYMVMPYLDGSTLASRLYTAPMSVPEALTTCLQIADALACAHAGGIVHRDLKPQNVMLTRSGQLKLLDFGLAKILPAANRPQSTVDTATALTTGHVLMGTPAYMAPEQIQEQPIDGRADLFALGAILFECLTGRQAFPGTGYLDVLGKILYGPVPSPAALRGDVPPPVDELCRKLLAKDPADRFQSATDVIEAIRSLLPGAGTSRPSPGLRVGSPFFQRRWRLASAAVIVVVAIAGALWVPALLRRGSPSPNPDAARWYDKGTEALRDGAFLNAAVALEEAVRIAPDYPAAYARLAEARAEIDDERAAQAALVRARQVGGALSTDERLRMDAISSLVLGDVDAAVKGYESLVQRHPTDAGALVDLGRAQERAGQLSAARSTYQQAISQDRQYAAAHLRLGGVEAAQLRREPALAAFSEADRLYRLASNSEGQVEVLIRRGALLNALSDAQGATAALNTAVALADAAGNRYQSVRARLHLSSAMLWTGRSSEAEVIASKAVQSAFDAGLQATAAEGLIDLASALMSRRPADAEAHVRRAADLAAKSAARRTAARAAIQLASLQLADSPQTALETLAPALSFLETQKYRRYELYALSIASRAHQQLDHLGEAETLARKVLREAEATGEESHVSEALSTLAVQSSMLGALPESVRYRERAEAIHRRRNDISTLPYDLTNKAETLILLGRAADADAALAQVDDGIRKKIESYVGRQRRVHYLRLLASAIEGDFPRVPAAAKDIAPGMTDAAAALTPALVEYARARMGQRPDASTTMTEGVTAATVRELTYWRGLAMFYSRRLDSALALATQGLAAARKISNDEQRWRFAALAAAAAARLGQADVSRTLVAESAGALSRLRAAWGDAIGPYLNRRDLVELQRAADLKRLEDR